MIAHESERARHRLLRQRYLTLLIALLLLFAFYPFIDQEVAETRHVGAFFSVILVAGAYAVSHNRRFLAVAVALAAGMLGAQWLAYAQHMNPVITAISRGFGCLFFLLTAIAILSNILKSKTVTSDTIYGAICAYLLLGLTWTFLFCVLEVLHPGSLLEAGHPIAAGQVAYPEFAMINSLIYYSLSTLSTVAYGDILPKTGPARSFSNLEAICGQMYLAILIARLVSMQIAHSNTRSTPTKE
jgi:voltage-gated potassium channel